MRVSQGALATMGSVAAIASSGAPARDRIQHVVQTLHRVIPYVAAHVAWIDRGCVTAIHANGYSEEIVNRFSSRDWVREAHVAMTHSRNAVGTTLRQQDLPEQSNVTVLDYLRPAGFKEGITLLMKETDGSLCGVLNLSCCDPGEATEEAREVVNQAGPTLTNLVREVHLADRNESVYVIGTDGRLTLQQGGSKTDDSHHESLVRDQLDRLGTLQPSVTTIPSDGADSGAYEMQVVALTSFDGVAVRGVVVIRDAGETLLSPREIEVIRLVAAGLTNAQISEELGIARRTVASHVEHILTRMGVGTRTAAAVLAAQSGLLVEVGRHRRTLSVT